MAATNVSDQVCAEVRKNIEKQFETDEKRLNSHGTDITDLKVIMAQLAQLQQTNTAQLTAMESRVRELEGSRHEHDVRSPPESLVNGSTVRLIIKGTFILLGIIILAAIGQNVSPEFITKLIGK